MIDVIAIGFAAGLVAGLLGVGGGILFVPALALLVGLDQVDAEATSLLAIVPVCMLGAFRQHRYGNVRMRDGLTLGVLSLGGVSVGVVVANAVPERALEIAFAVLMLFVAGQLARRGLKRPA